jgi:hypothetical protein
MPLIVFDAVKKRYLLYTNMEFINFHWYRIFNLFDLYWCSGIKMPLDDAEVYPLCLSSLDRPIPF